MFPKRYWFVILTYVGLALILGGFVVPLVLQAAFEFDPLISSVYGQIVTFSLSLIIILGLLKPDLALENKESKTGIGGILLWSLIGFFMVYIGQILAALIEMHILGIEPGSENTTLIVDIIEMVPIFFIIPAIIGPILEELVFRKVIFGALHKKMNFFFAALLSSVVFSAFHMDFEHLLVYAAIGFIFSFLYVKTKRIIVPIIAHITMNTFVMLIQLFVDIEQLEKMLEEIQDGFILFFFGG